MADRTESTPEQLRKRLTVDLLPVLGRAYDLGFLGSMPLDDQIDHSLGFLAMAERALAGAPTSFADLGTGGGVPGLVLAGCWASTPATFMDANERRTVFLIEETELLALGNITVVRGRLEEIAGQDEQRDRYPLVTSRSFSSPSVTAECAAPLLAMGGQLIVSEPPDETAGVRWDVEGLAQLGLRPTVLERWNDRFTYQLIEKVEPTPDRFPRRIGIPSKRPLF